MNNMLYGVDLTKKITPLIARDAIIKCFEQAHEEILNMMDEYTEWNSDEERKKFRDLRSFYVLTGSRIKSGMTLALFTLR